MKRVKAVYVFSSSHFRPFFYAAVAEFFLFIWTISGKSSKAVYLHFSFSKKNQEFQEFWGFGAVLTNIIWYNLTEDPGDKTNPRIALFVRSVLKLPEAAGQFYVFFPTDRPVTNPRILESACSSVRKAVEWQSWLHLLRPPDNVFFQPTDRLIFAGQHR